MQSYQSLLLTAMLTDEQMVQMALKTPRVLQKARDPKAHSQSPQTQRSLGW